MGVLHWFPSAIVLHGGGQVVSLLLSAILVSSLLPGTAAAQANANFAIEDKTNYPGADYKNFPTNDFYACVEACRKEAVCKSFTFVRPGAFEPQGRCWLKNATRPREANNCCLSGIKSVPAFPLIATGPAVSKHPNLNYAGNDYRHVLLDRADDAACQRQCQMDEKCRAFTYVRPGIQGPAATCWLKTAAGNAKADGCCSSGVKAFRAPAMGDLSLAPGTNRPGADYNNFALDIPDPQKCAAACRNAVKCRAYTFVNPQGNSPARCWLKTTAAPEKNESCCVSGAKPPQTGLTDPLVLGKATSKNVGCNDGPVKDVFDKLCKAVGSFTGVTCSSPSTSCSSTTRQVPTGTVAHDLQLLTPMQTHSDYGAYGGRGALLADAAMCTLRELSPQFSIGGTPAKGGPVDSEYWATLLGAKFGFRQRVGYLSFDPKARIFKGYRHLTFCAPIVGCYDSVAQDFTVDQVRYPVAPPISIPKTQAGRGSAPGTMTLATTRAYDQVQALNVTAEQTRKSVTLFLQKIPVTTPIGTTSIQPRFDYRSEEGVYGTPFRGETSTLRPAKSAPGWDGTAILHDLYGVDPVLAFPVTSGGRGVGWMSQLALGNRAPAEGAEVWQPSGSPGERPDRDLLKARSAENPGGWSEKNPSTLMTASITFLYPEEGKKASDFASQLGIPKWMLSGKPPEFYVWVKPMARAAFSGQFNLMTAEARAAQNFDVGTSPEVRSADLTLLSRAMSSFGVSIETGLHLKVWVPIPFVDGPVIDIHEPFTKSLGEGPVNANQRMAHFASAYDPSRGGKAYSHFQTFQKNLGRDNANQAPAYLAKCLAENVSSGTLPPPDPADPQPGDPKKLLDYLEVPCNICVHYRDESTTPDSFYVANLVPAPRPAGAKVWECDMDQKSGCRDTCRLTKDGKFVYVRGPDAALKFTNKVTGQSYDGNVCYKVVVK